MKKRIIAGLALALTLALTTAASAQAAQSGGPRFIDPHHSSVAFEVMHVVGKVMGRFNVHSGHIMFDPANPKAPASIQVIIDTPSIDTGVDKRDDHLRSEDFFDAYKFPFIVFSSSKITPKGGDMFEAEGTLTMKETTKAITLPFTCKGTKDDPLRPGHDLMGFEARLTLDRHEYKVGDEKFFKMGVVGKDVNVILHVEALRRK